MKANLTLGLVTLLLGFSIILIHPSETHAQNPNLKTVHVTGQPLPASLGFATVLEGGTTNKSLNIQFLVLSNTGSASQTVTVQDCTPTTPFVFFPAGTTIPGTGNPNSTWTIPLGGVRFTGCFKWQASSTNVQGSLVGTQ